LRQSAAFLQAAREMVFVRFRSRMKSDRFDKSIAEFAEAYFDKNEKGLPGIRSGCAEASLASCR
jgi:hypothetical protein